MQNKDKSLSVEPAVRVTLTENRSDIRIRVNLKAMYHLGAHVASHAEDWHACTILNISAGGALLAADNKLLAHPGDLLFLKFHIGKEYLLLAQIVWEQHISKIHHYGVSWCDLPRANQEQLVLAITRVAVKRRRMQKNNKI
jgi:hypothetical protein